MSHLTTLLGIHAHLSAAADALRAKATGVGDATDAAVEAAAASVEAARPDLTLSALPPESVAEAVGMWCRVAYAQFPGPYLLSSITEGSPTCTVFLPGAATKLTPHLSTVTLVPDIPRAFQPDGSAVRKNGDTP